MQTTKALAIFIVLLYCDQCLTVKVPTTWDDGASEVQEIAEQNVRYQNAKGETPIPVEYFQYTPKKPQFVVDVATFHGVPNPSQRYKAYPVRPFTEKEKPEFGIHHIQNPKKVIFQPLQRYTEKREFQKGHATPVSSNYEVFHPYKAKEPELQKIYKDPVLAKIRNDLRETHKSQQEYMKFAAEPDIKKDEYLESPEEIDRRIVPHRNVPTEFEIHKPRQMPTYYRPPEKFNNRDHILNKKFKHPWNQNHIKVRPMNYRPLQNYLQRLKKHHAYKYDDEKNEYPQVHPSENHEEQPEGYDIYEKGREKYVQLRNNVDESINKSVKENRPTAYKKLELQTNGNIEEEQTTDNNDNDDDEEDFVPIKNYAQVRKTETTKHLPREAAFDDADSLDELRNAPRLREAVKSSKAQTVYTEEGYEDAAYDHAGEQKHASDHEQHGGYLKQKELSAGKYKIPSVSASYEDEKGSAYRDETVHGEKWNDDKKKNNEENDTQDYSEEEEGASVESEIYHDTPEDDESPKRNKRENHSGDKESIPKISNEPKYQRQSNFKVPEINLNTTYLNEQDILRLTKLKIVPKEDYDIKEKYPYYFKNVTGISKDSPLRYSENLELIPKKSNGGTEFYDSRSKIQCQEVDTNVDPIPEKLKKAGHPDKESGKDVFDNLKEKQRLKGLGDKIDCFKAKYFGENPLDSPFFKEELILNPEPVTLPTLSTYKLQKPLHLSAKESKFNNVFNLSEKLKEENKMDIFSLMDKLSNGQNQLKESLVQTNEQLRSSLTNLLDQNKNVSQNKAQLKTQSNVYTDILDNIKINNKQRKNLDIEKITSNLLGAKLNTSDGGTNIQYDAFKNKEDVTKLPVVTRRKRSTQFVYEPYKIIRDGQFQDSRKTTTTSNVSPLIKQLQSSKVVNRVTKTSQDKEQPVKRNVSTRTYKDIGRKEREKGARPENEGILESSFIDVSLDQRRGEPRYELKPLNHKPNYTPVKNIKAMSVEEYEAQTSLANDNVTESVSNLKLETTTIRYKPETNSIRNNVVISDTKGVIETSTKSNSRRITSRQRRPTVRPYFDVSQYLPIIEIKTLPPLEQNSAASKTIRRVIKTTPEPKTTTSSVINKQDSGSDEDYEEYDEDDDVDDEDDEEEVEHDMIEKPTTTLSLITTSTTTTTTTTSKPSFRKRIRTSTTTIKPVDIKNETELPKLRLRTRLRTPIPEVSTEEEYSQKSRIKKVNDNIEVPPKYREKSKKSSKSTLVTDVKTYGDGDDDMRKEEIDALIGVKQDMKEYMPQYEKEDISTESVSGSSEDDEEDEYDDSDEEDSEEESDEESEEIDQKTTTPEPARRTLIQTTEIPISTTEARSANLKLKPLITKKKIEIHKELPVNKSSPHSTRFQQDIKEVEVIKEIPTTMPQKKTIKNAELLELYKDDDLAKAVNKLQDVEVFKKLEKNAPKHGGNYRSVEVFDKKEGTSSLKPRHGGHIKVIKDTEASESENSKLVELDKDIPVRKMHGGNLKSKKDFRRPKGPSDKLEIVENIDNSKLMHGGNLKSIQRTGKKEDKSAKLIELSEDEYDDDDDDDETSMKMHGGNLKPYGNSRSSSQGMHGGNYRSAKIVQADNEESLESFKTKLRRNTAKDARSSAAVLLNSFAQAVPILTTTPAYILDPSKRMYYYVEA